MKRLIRLFLFFFAVALISTSCELLEDCKTCSLVTYVNGVYDSETAGVVYCGEELDEIESRSPTIIGNRRTQYECY